MPAVALVMAAVPPAALAVLAQTQGVDLPTLLGAYGAATPFALVLLYWLRRESQRADRWEALYLALAERSATEVVPALQESQRIHEHQGAMLAELSTVQQTDPALMIHAERALREAIDRAERRPR